MNELPETDYLKVPADRVGALIGTKGETKQLIENAIRMTLIWKLLNYLCMSANPKKPWQDIKAESLEKMEKLEK